MTAYRDLAERMTSALRLDLSPVALAFVDRPPDGVARDAEVSPSACAFWRRAERGVFYAAAEQHHNCSVGAMVMGFELPGAVEDELGGVVRMMCDQGYLSPEEAARIPSVDRAWAGILYGPLADMPADPDLVLLWLAPEEAMLVNESADGGSWASPPARVGSRPACAALPLAASEGRPILSFGCIGMRTFTGIGQDRMLAAVPGEGLEAFVASLERVAAANRTMQDFYERRRAEVLS